MAKLKRKPKLHDQAFDELWSGYQAVGEALHETNASELSYEVGYADGWADAVNQVAWALDGKPVKPKKAFFLLSARFMRNKARSVLAEHRRILSEEKESDW